MLPHISLLQHATPPPDPPLFFAQTQASLFINSSRAAPTLFKIPLLLLENIIETIYRNSFAVVKGHNNRPFPCRSSWLLPNVDAIYRLGSRYLVHGFIVTFVSIWLDSCISLRLDSLFIWWYLLLASLYHVLTLFKLRKRYQRVCHTRYFLIVCPLHGDAAVTKRSTPSAEPPRNQRGLSSSVHGSTRGSWWHLFLASLSLTLTPVAGPASTRRSSLAPTPFL